MRAGERCRRLIRSRAPLRINDIGGWTDTWFAREGWVLNLAVVPAVEAQIKVYKNREKRKKKETQAAAKLCLESLSNDNEENDRRFVMKKSPLLLGLIFLAAIIAFGPSLALGQPARNPERTLRPFWEDYLDLTPDQKARLEEFRKARQEEREAFLDQMEKFRAELRELREDPQANEKKIDALIDETFKLRAGHLKSSFKHQAEVKKVFTPEQQEKLAKLRARMAHFRDMRPGAFFGRGGGRLGMREHFFRERVFLRHRLRDRWRW